ncbi:hypothetical protein F4777DRAFT_521265 [Nemania sp. FL0916]|nr:hypothetical protein F4777DRAFT_521265 [Nemania sp. FL0916]
MGTWLQLSAWSVAAWGTACRYEGAKLSPTEKRRSCRSHSLTPTLVGQRWDFFLSSSVLSSNHYNIRLAPLAMIHSDRAGRLSTISAHGSL